jgi:hypothetical protein
LAEAQLTRRKGIQASGESQNGKKDDGREVPHSESNQSDGKGETLENSNEWPYKDVQSRLVVIFDRKEFSAVALRSVEKIK